VRLGGKGHPGRGLSSTPNADLPMGTDSHPSSKNRGKDGAQSNEVNHLQGTDWINGGKGFLSGSNQPCSRLFRIAYLVLSTRDLGIPWRVTRRLTAHMSEMKGRRKCAESEGEGQVKTSWNPDHSKYRDFRKTKGIARYVQCATLRSVNAYPDFWFSPRHPRSDRKRRQTLLFCPSSSLPLDKCSSKPIY